MPKPAALPAIVLATSTLVILAGCAAASPQAAQDRGAATEHTTAASGFGLGPENFNGNGGAFGPDQLSK